MVMEAIIDAIRSQWFFSIHWLHGKDMTCLAFFPGPNDFWPRTWASLPDSWDVCILFLILTWVFSRVYWTFGQKKHFFLFQPSTFIFVCSEVLANHCEGTFKQPVYEQREILPALSPFFEYRGNAHKHFPASGLLLFITQPYTEGLHSWPQQSPVTGTADWQPPVTADFAPLQRGGQGGDLHVTHGVLCAFVEL